MPPRPSRGPTSLHLASLGSPFALLTDPPPPRFTSFPSRRILPAVFPLRHLLLDLLLLLQPLHAALLALTRVRERLSRGAPSFLFLLSHGRFLSPFLSAAPLARASTSLTLPPFSSCSCSLFLLGRPHRAFSSTVRVREHRERLFVSPRLPRFASLFSSSSTSSFSLSPIFSLSASPLFLPSCFFLSFLFLSYLLSFRRPFLRPLPTLLTCSPSFFSRRRLPVRVRGVV